MTQSAITYSIFALNLRPKPLLPFYPSFLRAPPFSVLLLYLYLPDVLRVSLSLCVLLVSHTTENSYASKRCRCSPFTNSAYSCVSLFAFILPVETNGSTNKKEVRAEGENRITQTNTHIGPITIDLDCTCLQETIYLVVQSKAIHFKENTSS